MNIIVPDTLFLGNYRASEDYALLRQHGITHIVVCGHELEKAFPKKFTYFHVTKLHDVAAADIISYFMDVFDFIEKAVQNNGRVLVHCAAGVSRSASFTIGYLMYKNKWSFDYTLNLVREARPIVLPNQGFVKQLKLFEEMGNTIVYEHPSYIAYYEQARLPRPKPRAHAAEKSERKSGLFSCISCIG